MASALGSSENRTWLWIIRTKHNPQNMSTHALFFGRIVAEPGWNTHFNLFVAKCGDAAYQRRTCASRPGFLHHGAEVDFDKGSTWFGD
jgi:hypothetical protein